MRQPVTPSLLQRLVVGSHAEGTTQLAVTVVIEDNERILLLDVNNTADTLDRCWQPPSDQVLPGETLDDAVHRTAATAGIDLNDIADYLGHRDLPAGKDLVRTFIFAAAIRPGHACCATARAPYRWAQIDDLPDDLDGEMLALIHTSWANAR